MNGMLPARAYSRAGGEQPAGWAFQRPAAMARLLLLWLMALLLAACGRQPAGNDAPLIPTQVVSPANTPLIEAAGTVPTTATISQQPAPTVTVAIPPTETPSPTPLACDLSWFFAPAPEACPAGQPTVSAAAEQPFENGVMIWLEASDSILVLHQDGRWQRFEDTWSEGEPESDPDISPPDGRFQPIRGFGKLWRQQPGVRDALGWALGVELGFESTFQGQAPGPDRPMVTYVRTYNGQIFALVGRAPDQGDWVVAADNR